MCLFILVYVICFRIGDGVNVIKKIWIGAGGNGRDERGFFRVNLKCF